MSYRKIKEIKIKITRRHSTFFFTFGILFFLILSSKASAKSPIREENERIVEILLNDGTFISEGIIAYQDKGDWLFPLYELSQSLDFAIQVDPSNKFANGYFIREENSLLLDGKQKKINIKSKNLIFPENKLYFSDTDIYVPSKILSSWFQFKIQVEPYKSRATIIPTEKLPIQLRKSRISKGISQSTNTQRALYEIEKNKNHLINGFFIDHNLSISHSPNNSSQTNKIQNNIAISGELFGLEARSYFLSSNNTLLSKSFTLSSFDHESKLLGPLKASTIEFISIRNPAINLISKAESGYGVTINNYLQKSSNFYNHTFQETIQPGWDIELYRDQTLIRKTTADEKGDYSIEDVSLHYGTNRFKLVYYGPKGQIKTKDQSFYIDPSLTGGSKLLYKVSSYLTGSKDLNSSLQLEKALHKNLSLNLAIHNKKSKKHKTNETHSLLGISTSVKQLYLNISGAQDHSDGSVMSYNLKLSYPNTFISATHQKLFNYKSNYFGVGSEFLSQVSRVEISPQFSLFRTYFQNIFIAEQEIDILKQTKESYTHRVSFFLSNFYYTNEIETSSLSNNNTWSGEGSINWFYELNAYKVWAKYSKENLSGIGLDNRLNFNNNFNVNSSMVHDYNSNINSLNLSFETYFKKILINLGGSANNEVGLEQVSLELSWNGNYDHKDRSWQQIRKPNAELSAAKVFVFLDSNDNGVFDKDEHTLEGISFSVNGHRYPKSTDHNGKLFIPNISPHTLTNIELDISSLNNPLHFPKKKGVSLYPSIGKVYKFNFPIIATKEVAGYVYLIKDNTKKIMPGIKIELLDHKNNVIKKSFTLGDGFFLLDKIPHGHYILRPSNSQLSNLKLTSQPKELPLIIKESDDYIENIKFTLSSKNKLIN